VLTQRIAYFDRVRRSPPWQILAVTFTNKAAKEMDQRVKAMLNEQATDGMMLAHSIRFVHESSGVKLNIFHSNQTS